MKFPRGLWLKKVKLCIFDYVKTIFLFNTSSPCSQSRVFNNFFRESPRHLYSSGFFIFKSPDARYDVHGDELSRSSG